MYPRVYPIACVMHGSIEKVSDDPASVISTVTFLPSFLTCPISERKVSRIRRWDLWDLPRCKPIVFLATKVISLLVRRPKMILRLKILGYVYNLGAGINVWRKDF